MEDTNVKTQILEKAVSLFSQKGYDGVGIQEICNDSGITKPTLYYYFGSKKGLLDAIADTKSKQLFEIVKNALEYKHDFILSLTTVFKAELNFAQNNKDFFRLHSVLMNSPENTDGFASYKKIKEDLNELFFQFFISSANEFGNMRSKEKLYSQLFHNNILSLAIDSISNSINFDEHTIYQIIHSFVYGVAN